MSNFPVSLVPVRGNVILLLPTLEGRDTLYDALRSVKPVAECFCEIIISVNGTTPQATQAIVSEIFEGHSIDIQVLCTGEAFEPIAHIRFMYHNLVDTLKHDMKVFMMADDDVLCSKESVCDYIAHYKSQRAGCIGFGNLLSSVDLTGEACDELQDLLPGEMISPLLFLERNRSGHLFTNITGMIVPSEVLLDAWNFMLRLGSKGRRYEYILASHAKVTTLLMPKEYTATIRVHRQQWGRALSNKFIYRDEIVYYLWVWSNQPLARPFAKGRNDYGFKIMGFFSLLLKVAWHDPVFLYGLTLAILKGSPLRV